MSIKSKLKLLFDEISAEYQRLSYTTTRKTSTERTATLDGVPDPVLIDSIIGLFRKYTESVNQELKERKSNDEYQQLERSLQTQQAQIRNHIRLEQQMKLYAQSLQSKIQEAEKFKVQSSTLNNKIIQNLRKEIQKLQSQYRILKQKDLSSLITTQSTQFVSKQKGYASIRCDTENRKTPTKQSKKHQVLKASNSFLSRSHAPYNDITNSIHLRTQAEDKHRSVSRQESSNKVMKTSSIHVLPKKSNFLSHRK